MTLHQLFLNNNRNEIYKFIHYLDIYERYFFKYVGKKILMIEIGVWKGGSLNMWKDYFGDNATIVGIDIDRECKQYENEERNIFVEIGDQKDPLFLESIIRKYGNPDIILDDGSHIMLDIKNSFDFLFYRMKDEGIYMVEDLQTSYWPEFGGGAKKPGSFIEVTKEKIDELNAENSRGTVTSTDFTKSIYGISIYENVVVFEKRKYSKKQAIRTSGE